MVVRLGEFILTVLGILNFCLPMITWVLLTDTVFEPIVHVDPEHDGITEPSSGRMRRIFLDMMAVFSMAFHSLFMTGIMTVIFLTLKNAVVSFIVPVLCEAVSTIILSLGMPPALLPLVWGMYRYSHDIFGDKGFSIAAVFEVTLVFAAALLLFPLIKRFRRLALRLLV